MSKTVLIETKRAVLVPLTTDCASLIFEYYQKNLEHLYSWDAESANAYDLQTWQAYADWSQKQSELGQQFEFIALDHQQSRMLALISFTQVTQAPTWSCELGFSIAKDMEGQGLMYELLQTVIEYVFNIREKHRIVARYHLDNVRSERLLKRLGFEYEGCAKSYQKLNGVWCDYAMTAIVNSNH